MLKQSVTQTEEEWELVLEYVQRGSFFTGHRNYFANPNLVSVKMPALS